jgi:hypothetical protein
MNKRRPAGAAALPCLVLVLSWLNNSPARAQEFRSLLSQDLTTILNTYQGSTSSGNTITKHSRFQNISARPFVITGLADIQSRDPEDLGYPDLTPENATAIRAAMLALYPSYDLFLSTGWSGNDKPPRVWETEITFGSPFPITVNVGEEFEFIRVSRNDLFGPNFGPRNAPLLSTQADTIGEVVIAVDLDWHYVPEPGGALLLVFGALLAWPRMSGASRIARARRLGLALLR